MNDMASMRKMRPLESFGSGGSARVVSGLGVAAGEADFFFGGKPEFYSKRSAKILTQVKLASGTRRLHSAQQVGHQVTPLGVIRSSSSCPIRAAKHKQVSAAEIQRKRKLPLRRKRNLATSKLLSTENVKFHLRPSRAGSARSTLPRPTDNKRSRLSQRESKATT